jgi:hypothetical protein
LAPDVYLSKNFVRPFIFRKSKKKYKKNHQSLEEYAGGGLLIMQQAG